MRQWGLPVFSMCLCLVFCPAPESVTSAAAEPSSRYEVRREHDPDGIGKFYLGREIAQVMGHLAAGWLDRPEREREEQPTKLMDLLKIKEGESIADIGA